jgi:hypothetical protein
MRKFGYQWPEIFDCEKMPPNNKDGIMCVGENESGDDGEAKSRVGETKESEKNSLECPHAMKVLTTNRLAFKF